LARKGIKNAVIPGVTAFKKRSCIFLLGSKTFFACFFQAGLDPFLVNRADRFSGNFQADPLIFFGDIEPFRLQVGQESPEGLDVRVGDFMAFNGLLSGNFTNSCHDIQIILSSFQKWSAKDGIFFEMCKCFLIAVFFSATKAQKHKDAQRSVS
jgi:hypothetical protein